MIDAAGLRVMKAIADEGSFTAAATSLGYTQPAISQMVRRLEQRTGTVLVERVGRNVRLTEAGQVLARHATPVLAAIDAAEEEVAAIAGLRSGRVTAVARPIHIGRTTHVWDIRLCSDEGKASCVSRLTMAVVPLGEAPAAR